MVFGNLVHGNWDAKNFASAWQHSLAHHLSTLEAAAQTSRQYKQQFKQPGNIGNDCELHVMYVMHAILSCMLCMLCCAIYFTVQHEEALAQERHFHILISFSTQVVLATSPFELPNCCRSAGLELAFEEVLSDTVLVANRPPQDQPF